jgi:GTP-binding protein
MIVGEHSRDNDLDVNASRGKQLTNIRSAGNDDGVFLAPPRIFNLEEAMGYIASDEQLEVTPNHMRMRKLYLDPVLRKQRKNKKGIDGQ